MFGCLRARVRTNSFGLSPRLLLRRSDARHPMFERDRACGGFSPRFRTSKEKRVALSFFSVFHMTDVRNYGSPCQTAVGDAERGHPWWSFFFLEGGGVSPFSVILMTLWRLPVADQGETNEEGAGPIGVPSPPTLFSILGCCVATTTTTTIHQSSVSKWLCDLWLDTKSPI